jgi:hypothetical protein
MLCHFIVQGLKITWNFYEISDDPSYTKVLLTKGFKYIGQPTDSFETGMSIMFCINAKGKILTTYVSYKSEYICICRRHGRKMGPLAVV